MSGGPTGRLAAADPQPRGLLEARDLVVELAGRRIVDGVSLSLRPARAVALVGPSGCGKSTLGRALVGLEPGLRGSLYFDGAQLVGTPRRSWAALRSRVQLCWQDPLRALDPRRSALRSINEARVLAGLAPWRRGDPELRTLSAQLGLDADLLERRPATISGGQRQRVALARALAPRPELLIADEITSALDRPLAMEIVGRLAARVRGGLGVLLITHDLSLLPGRIDEVLVLSGGAIIERASPETLLRSPQHPLSRSLCEALPRLPAGVTPAVDER